MIIYFGLIFISNLNKLYIWHPKKILKKNNPPKKNNPSKFHPTNFKALASFSTLMAPFIKDPGKSSKQTKWNTAKESFESLHPTKTSGSKPTKDPGSKTKWTAMESTSMPMEQFTEESGKMISMRGKDSMSLEMELTIMENGETI